MSKTYCDYPWEHIYIHTTGHCKICCMSEDNITKDNGYSHFNAKDGDIMEAWNSKNMKDIRLKMLKGERLPNCEKCYFAEDSGLTSMRKTKSLEENRQATSEDGSTTQSPKFLELHFGNVCNLSCKMCSQMFSHTIGKELMKMGKHDPEFLVWIKKESGLVNNWTGELDQVYDWYKVDKVKRSIFEMVSNHVKSLNIIGGEPTIIPQFFELFEYCEKQNTLGDKDITICTNLTNTNPRLRSLLPKLKRFMIHASIDGVDKRNRYIRYPSDWDTIQKSLQFYKDTIKDGSNGFISFAPAVQMLNIDQLVYLTEYFENHCGQNDKVAWTSHVRYPLICDYDYAPQSYKSKVAESLRGGIGKIQDPLNRKEILAHADRLDTESNHDHRQTENVQKAFIRYNDTQDSFRRELTWRQLLPDLEQALTQN